MVRTVLDALTPRLQEDPCLAESRPVNEEGRLDCSVVEATTEAPGQCSCDPQRRRDSISFADPPIDAYVAQIRSDPAYADRSCFCIIQQCQEGDLAACQNRNEEPVIDALGGNVVQGWCYVDPTAFVGSQDIVASCPVDRRRRIRFLGEAQPDPAADLFLICP
jgi:hypothetical protein